ncbi:cupredoxin domain-containing protein [Ferroacidibacillus organovorans]|uniref:cupredoxin domain-containing protein n=1 Tax=Ferroacidibacillus organovorans TaxID=1765683 RepID=UPI0022B24618|nr:cupredoxin domain-containing protein [Ferroacidibacillus organovorans]
MAVCTICGSTCFATVTHAEEFHVAITAKGFVPNELRATGNGPIRIDIVNQTDHVHNFVLPKYFLFTQNLQPKEKTYVSFVPDKAGRFEFYSDTGGKKEQGYSGYLQIDHK